MVCFVLSIHDNTKRNGNKYKPPYVATFVLGILGQLLYFSAVLLPKGTPAIYAVILARFVCGMGELSIIRYTLSCFKKAYKSTHSIFFLNHSFLFYSFQGSAGRTLVRSTMYIALLHRVDHPIFLPPFFFLLHFYNPYFFFSPSPFLIHHLYYTNTHSRIVMWPPRCRWHNKN